MSAPPKIVLFGAGAAGKGLIGLLFHQAGYHVVFVDILADLVAAMGDARRYEVLIHRLDGTRQTSVVQGFDIHHAADRDLVARECIDADLILTAVVAPNLPDVAITVAKGVAACRAAGRTQPLHCVACENMKSSSSTLKGFVDEHLTEELKAYADATFAFPDCMINRMVPTPNDPLHVETEDYCEWTVDAGQVKGHWPSGIDFIERVENQPARLDRKLMVYNGIHAACAYFGLRRGHALIPEAVADPDVARLVSGTLDQLVAVIERHHGFSPESMTAYRRDAWLRLHNPGLKDQTARIGRDPARKLGRHDRLVGPAKLAELYGLPRDHIVRAIRAALEVGLPDRIARDGLRETLAAVSGLDVDDPLMNELEIL